MMIFNGISNNNTLTNKSNNINTYSALLQHTNRILNFCYELQTTCASAHSPILIDRDIKNELVYNFQK